MNGKARPAVNFFAWVSNIDHRSTIRPGRVGVSPRAPRLLSVTESIALPPFCGRRMCQIQKIVQSARDAIAGWCWRCSPAAEVLARFNAWVATGLIR